MTKAVFLKKMDAGSTCSGISNVSAVSTADLVSASAAPDRLRLRRHRATSSAATSSTQMPAVTIQMVAFCVHQPPSTAATGSGSTEPLPEPPPPAGGGGLGGRRDVMIGASSSSKQSALPSSPNVCSTSFLPTSSDDPLRWKINVRTKVEPSHIPPICTSTCDKPRKSAKLLVKDVCTAVLFTKSWYTSFSRKIASTP
jgi:hypothetical protein